MDVRELHLDCSHTKELQWYVYDETTGEVLSKGHKDSEFAWMNAATHLASVISGIRRTVCDFGIGKEPD